MGTKADFRLVETRRSLLLDRWPRRSVGALRGSANRFSGYGGMGGLVRQLS